MSDVRFDEPQYAQSASARPQQMSVLSRATVAVGLAKDETGAQKTMIIGTIVIAVFAVGIYFYSQSVTASTGKFIPAQYPPATYGV